MYAPAPALGKLQLARLSDLPRIGPVAAAGFITRQSFTLKGLDSVIFPWIQWPIIGRSISKESFT